MKNKLFILKYLKFAKLLKCVPELKQILSAKSDEERKFLLEQVNNCVIDSIGELSLNLLNGLIPFKKTTLVKHKKTLFKIADNKLPVTRRRKILIQKGGFLPLLIEPSLYLLSGIVGEIIGKKLLK